LESSDTQEVHSGDEDNITAVEAFPAVKTMKAGKAAICDEIQPEILKALNREIPGLSPVCRAAWHFEIPLIDWQTGATISIHKKENSKQCNNYRGISLLTFHKNYMPSDGNKKPPNN